MNYEKLLWVVVALVTVETTAIRYTAQASLYTKITLVEILTALAVLPFFAALVVGAREAEQDQR